MRDWAEQLAEQERWALPPLLSGTPRTVRCAAFFVRSEKSTALVGGGFLQPAPRSAKLDSAFGGMQLFATEASLESSSSAAHTLCTVGTAYCAAATAVTAMGSPSLALSHLCCGLCERHCSAAAGTL